jgi:hypothetical protein
MKDIMSPKYIGRVSSNAIIAELVTAIGKDCKSGQNFTLSEVAVTLIDNNPHWKFDVSNTGESQEVADLRHMKRVIKAIASDVKASAQYMHLNDLQSAFGIPKGEVETVRTILDFARDEVEKEVVNTKKANKGLQHVKAMIRATKPIEPAKTQSEVDAEKLATAAAMG